MDPSFSSDVSKYSSPQEISQPEAQKAKRKRESPCNKSDSSPPRKSRPRLITIGHDSPMPLPLPVNLSKKQKIPMHDYTIDHRHTNPADLPGGVQVFQGVDRDNSNQLHSPDRGSKLDDAFKANGQEVVTERAERVEVVGILKKSHQDRLAYLESIPIEYQTETGKQQAELTAENIPHVDACLEKSQTWAGSASYRRLLESSGAKAQQQYVPTLVNLRCQTVRTANGEVASILNRSGAISDYRNGDTNLAELKELQESLKGVKKTKQLTDHQREVLSRINVFLDNPSSSEPIESIRNKVAEVITSRQWVLENQALQDLTQHISNIAATGADLQSTLDSLPVFSLGRVSMLDGIKKSKREESGFVINEANQMRDMEAIYNVLNGKIMIFDGSGPFLDEEGFIHMPFELKNEDQDHLMKPLEVIFFNISAQGNVKNEGPQKAINQKALSQLYIKVQEVCKQLVEEQRYEDAQQISERFVNLRRDLTIQTVTDGFSVAEDAAMLLLDLDLALSINCFSGKDRTGLLAALVTFNGLKTEVAKMNLRPSQERKLLATWGRQLMSEGHIAAEVVKDCTGYSALKLSVINVSLLFQKASAGDFLKGAHKRISGLGMALGTFITEPGTTGGGQLWEAGEAY